MTSGLPCCDASIQKRGKFLQVFEGDASSSSSCESEEEPSFFRFVKLWSDVVATEPDAAGTELCKREERMVVVSFLPRPWSPPTTEPNEGTPSMGQSPACRVPGIHGRYIQAQSFLISAILIQLSTRIAPAICPLKGRQKP